MGIEDVFYSTLVVFWTRAFYFSLVGISLFITTILVLLIIKKTNSFKAFIFYYQFFCVNVALLLAAFSMIEFSIFNYRQTGAGMGLVIFSDHPNFDKDILLLVSGPIIFLAISVLPIKIYCLSMGGLKPPASAGCF